MLRLIFLEALRDLPEEPAYYFPSDLSELKGSKGPPGLVETEGECCGDGFVAERFVAESLLTSSHRFLARGKAESFSLDHRAFTKNHKGRRLSLVSEDRVHQQGWVVGRRKTCLQNKVEARSWEAKYSTGKLSPTNAEKLSASTRCLNPLRYREIYCGFHLW